MSADDHAPSDGAVLPRARGINHREKAAASAASPAQRRYDGFVQLSDGTAYGDGGLTALSDTHD